MLGLQNRAIKSKKYWVPLCRWSYRPDS